MDETNLKSALWAINDLLDVAERLMQSSELSVKAHGLSMEKPIRALVAALRTVPH